MPSRGRRWLALLWSAALCLAALPAHSTDGLPEPVPGATAEDILSAQPRELVEALRAKKVVMLQKVRERKGRDEGLIVGFVIFAADRESVYGLLSQTSRQIEFRPEITSIETLSRDADGPVDRHTIRILFNRFVYHLRWHLDPAHRTLRWTLDDRRENDLERLRGSWELFEMKDGGTLGRFTTSVNVGRAVPGFLQDYITRRNLPETMERNRRWVDSGGTYRP
jgi:hypothetical protein